MTRLVVIAIAIFAISLARPVVAQTCTDIPGELHTFMSASTTHVDGCEFDPLPETIHPPGESGPVVCPAWPPWTQTPLGFNADLGPYGDLWIYSAAFNVRIWDAALTQSFVRWDTDGLPDDAVVDSAAFVVHIDSVDITNLSRVFVGDWAHLGHWPVQPPAIPGDPGDFRASFLGTALPATNLLSFNPLVGTDVSLPLANLSEINVVDKTVLQLGLESVSTLPSADCGAAGWNCSHAIFPPNHSAHLSFHLLTDTLSLHVCYFTGGATPTPVETATPVIADTGTPTSSATATVTHTATPADTVTPGGPQTPTDTPTLTATPTSSVTATPTKTPTRTARPSECIVKPTASPTRTAVPGCPECGPTPIAERCLGQWGECTQNGLHSPNLGLCKPKSGETPWLFAINSDANLESWLFPGCVLEETRGGLGADLAPPASGDLLVGSAGVYAPLPVELGSCLVTEPNAPAYRAGVVEVAPSAPQFTDCDQPEEFGRLYYDSNAFQFCVCLGQLHWKCQGVVD